MPRTLSRSTPSGLPVLVTTLAVALDLAGFGMVVVAFPLRAEGLVPPAWAGAKGAIVGALLASTFVIQLLASPRWGRWADRNGRRRGFVMTTLLSALGMAAFGAAGGLALLIVSRVLSGLGAANVAIAQAAVADATDDEARVKAQGQLSAGLNGGLVLGAALGGEFGYRFGASAVGWLGAGLSLTAALLVFFFGPADRPVDPAAPEPPRRAAWDLLVGRPKLARLVGVAGVAWFSLAMLEGTFARLIRTYYGYGGREFGWIFGYESLLGIAVGAFLVSRFRSDFWLRTAYLAQGIGLAMNPVAGFFGMPLAGLFLASTLYAAGVGLSNPLVNARAAEGVPEDRRGELFGLVQGARAVGFIAGPIVGGALFDRVPWGPYALAALACAVAAAAVPRNVTRTR